MQKGTDRVKLIALSYCSLGKGFHSSKPFRKHKEICKGTTDDILSSVGLDASRILPMTYCLQLDWMPQGHY